MMSSKYINEKLNKRELLWISKLGCTNTVKLGDCYLDACNTRFLDLLIFLRITLYSSKQKGMQFPGNSTSIASRTESKGGDFTCFFMIIAKTESSRSLLAVKKRTARL